LRVADGIILKLIFFHAPPFLIIAEESDRSLLQFKSSRVLCEPSAAAFDYKFGFPLPTLASDFASQPDRRVRILPASLLIYLFQPLKCVPSSSFSQTKTASGISKKRKRECPNAS
jgi:hypothetical protein